VFYDILLQEVMMPTIRELREQAGISQRELARRSGVHYMSIYQWEAGKHRPRFDQMRAVARALGVSMDDIDLVEVSENERHDAPETR
jgi:transcriptional regulator with XRE-family HTH domain